MSEVELSADKNDGPLQNVTENDVVQWFSTCGTRTTSGT